MPRRSTLIQRVVFQLQRQIFNAGAVEESAMLEDSLTETVREVDIVIRTKVAKLPLTIAIECTEGKRLATVEWVEQMHAKHLSLPTDKLVLVSASGFSKAAQQKASLFKIDLVKFLLDSKTSWPPLLRQVATEPMAYVVSRFTRCALVFADDPNTAHSMPPNTPLFCGEASGSMPLRDYLHGNVATSPDFMAGALEAAKKADFNEFEFQFFTEESIGVRISDSQLRLIKLFVIGFECKPSAGSLELREGSYMGDSIAFGTVETQIGQQILSIMQTDAGNLVGSVTQAKTTASTAETVSLEVFPQHANIRFISEPFKTS
jgi:hypothetical protein